MRQTYRGNPKTETKRTNNAQTLKVSEIGLYFRKLKSRKRKGNTLSPREKERIIKVKITSRREEEKGEKYKQEESKKSREEVIEIEPLQETTHAPND